jgi:long-chain acyl-CoA synthetase
VFSSIHQKTGGNVRFLVSGGAALSPHIEEFFNAIGLPVVQGYGLTETSPIISANLDQTIGSVGKVLPNVQLNILPDTEIAVKGPSVFSGYLNVPNTDTFTDDGFFKTGDCGYVDDHGHLFITGRKKELIVLSNGKNVPPTHIEDILSQSDLIHQVMVIGNERPYLTAVIVPEIELLEHRLSMDHSDHSFDASAKELILSDIAHYSSALASFETVKKIALIYDAFSIDGTELTPTLKLRRKIINKKYHDLIKSLYDD